MSNQSLHQSTLRQKLAQRRIARLRAAIDGQTQKLSPQPIIERLRRLADVLDDIRAQQQAEADASIPFDGRPMYAPEVTSRNEVL